MTKRKIKTEAQFRKEYENKRIKLEEQFKKRMAKAILAEKKASLKVRMMYNHYTTKEDKLRVEYYSKKKKRRKKK